MNGIEIIDTTINLITKSTNSDIASVVTVASAILFSAIAIAIFCFTKINEKPATIKNATITFLLALSPIWGMIIGGVVSCEFIEQEVIVGEERIYEVSVSDSVPFNDIASKYEILSYNGETYTIKEQVMYDEPVPVEN